VHDAERPDAGDAGPKKKKVCARRPGSSTQSPSFAQASQPPWLAVYLGQTCVGHTLNRDKLGYEAYDRDDRSLGVFADQSSTASAVAEAAS
jgi:hypothetical protein